MDAIDFDVFDPHQTHDMWDVARRLRRTAPVARITGGFVFVSRYEDCREVFRNDETFTAKGGFRPTGVVIPLEDSSIGELGPPIHGPIRKLASTAAQGGGVTRRARPVARDVSQSLLDDISKQSCAELMSQVSLPLTNRIMAWLLGVPMKYAERLSDWGEEIMLSTLTVTNETARGVGYRQAFPEFTEFLERLIEDRLNTDGSQDTIARVVRAGLDGDDLTIPIIRMVLHNLLLGGTATTRDLIGNLLLEILRNPALHAALREDRDRIPLAIEESLRLSPPVLYLIRTCAKPTELAGVGISEGERVVIGVASANRDEEIFEESEVFRIDRINPAGHLSFGLGQHFCVGAPLARIEAEELLNAFLDRFAPGEMRLAPDFELEWMPMPYMYGPLRVDVQL